MATRNIKQFEASVKKLAETQVKHTDIQTIVENGKPEIVSSDHETLVELAAELRQLASNILAEEKQYASDEVVARMTKDKALMAEYAARMSGASVNPDQAADSSSAKENGDESSQDDLGDFE